MVRHLALKGGLTLLLIGVFTQAHAWSPPQRQVGWASWYGAYQHGRQTASAFRCTR